MEHFFRYKQIYGEKLPLVKIRENKLFRHRSEAIGRPVIHTHHIYLNEHIFFWMLRAQIIRSCNVEMKIWGFTPSSDAFSKWLSRRKCRKTKNRNFCISTSYYHRYTKFISRYMFLRMTNMAILVKILYISNRTSKFMMAANFGQKIVISMKSTNMPVSVLPKTKRFKVLCVVIANYGVNNERDQRYMASLGFYRCWPWKRWKMKNQPFQSDSFYLS